MQPFTKILAAAALVVVTVSAARPAAADALSDAVGALAGGVEDVRIAGDWKIGTRTGLYRLLLARSGEPAVARLFIQWIGLGPGGQRTVERSMEIQELATLKVDVIDYSADSRDDGLSVFLDTENPTDGAEATYEVIVSGPDKYKFGKATN